MKMMKIFFAVLLLAAIFTACKKDATKPVATIEGTWVGKFGTGENAPSSFYSFNIKADGTIQEVNAAGEVVGEGTWELDNKILYATYSYFTPSTKVYSILGAFDKNQGKLLGNWGYNESATNGGLWEMTKK